MIESKCALNLAPSICKFIGKVVDLVICSWFHFVTLYLKMFIAYYFRDNLTLHSAFETVSPVHCC